jgi:hypothetical protein
MNWKIVYGARTDRQAIINREVEITGFKGDKLK